MEKFGLKGLVINSDTLHEAQLQGQNLWDQAEAGPDMIFMAPEQLVSSGFNDLIKADGVFAKRGPLRPTSSKSARNGFFLLRLILYIENARGYYYSHTSPKYPKAEVRFDGRVKKQTIGERTTVFSKIL
jgi:hypothetical protein